jgi:two-component system sensor histidine kinase BaeS
MPSTLRGRLSAAFAIIGLASALLTAVLVNIAFDGRFDAYLEQQRAAREQQLATAFSASYDTADRWDPDRLDRLASLVAMAGAEVRLTDAEDRFVWSLASTQMGPEMASMHRDMTAAGPLLPEQPVPLGSGGRQIGTLYVQLPEGTVPVADRSFRDAINRLLVLGGLIAGSLSVVAGLAFAYRTNRPVTELTSAARDLREGDRSRRAEVRGPAEIADMAQAFNDLVDSLEREGNVRRAFAADVAHELRTPLAVLRSELEAVQDGVLEPTPGLVLSLHEEVLRLGRLTSDLETMTVAEGVQFDLRHERVDLAHVAAATIAVLRHRFDEQGLRVTENLEPAVTSGDEARLRQVVTNLLTNTLKFVAANGVVNVSTATTGGDAVLTVCDTGPGIDEHDLPRIFERFYRGRHVRTGGSGIGLAVVATLVHAHHGEVSAGNSAGGGACFEVRIPVSQHPGG